MRGIGGFGVLCATHLVGLWQDFWLLLSRGSFGGCVGTVDFRGSVVACEGNPISSLCSVECREESLWLWGVPLGGKPGKLGLPRLVRPGSVPSKHILYLHITDIMHERIRAAAYAYTLKTPKRRIHATIISFLLYFPQLYHPGVCLSSGPTRSS